MSASSAGLAGWRTLVTAAELSDSRPGRVCGVGSITAVGFLGTQELVGASCARRGVVGVFSAPRGSWRRDSLQLVGPRLSSSLGHSGSRCARTASDVDRALRACQPCPRRRRRTCRCLHSGRHAELAGFPSAARTQRRRRDLLRPDRREWTFRPDLGSGSPAHTCGAACSGYGMGHLGLSAARNRHRRVRPRGQR